MKILLRAFGSVLALGSMVFLASAACREEDAPCERAPVGEVSVFLENEGPSASFMAVPVEIGPVLESGFRRYVVAAGDTMHVVAFRAPADSLPIEIGQTYDLTVETVPGSPTPSAIVIRDANGLLFAAASDYRPGERVLTEGLPGFGIALEEADCPDRAANRCYATEINGMLRATHEDSTVRLYQGGSAVLEGYRIRSLTARTLTYSDECADAGAFGVSYTVRRLP